MNLPYPTPPAPTVLLVGFLGSGKTSFIRKLLPLLRQKGLEPYVVINDYQNARIDANSLNHLAEEVEAINGSCVCCDSIHELINLLLDMPEKPNRVVLIEANGTTDPFSLIEHLMAHAELRQRFSPLIQVGVIDIERWQKRNLHNDLERLQAESASHYVLSRGDTAKPDRCARVRSDLEWLNSSSIETSPDKLAEELSGLVKKSASLQQPKSIGLRTSRTADPSCHPLAHGFVAFQLDLPAQVNGATFYQWLRKLPAGVLRVKGLVELAELPGLPFVFQRTDELRGEPTMFPLTSKPTIPPCAVLIGVRLPQEEIRQDAIAQLGAPEKAAA